jgi:hypothetical protein
LGQEKNSLNRFNGLFLLLHETVETVQSISRRGLHRAKATVRMRQEYSRTTLALNILESKTC